ncbi:MAG: fatty acyl-AMP ligase [Legionella sp.]|uniref:fatty acyl-AMP ligase n=1 Tax=Legionella sp. TaxID=459 RepID=UPI00284F0448|nr:fatty acyl-AMP ligase [Legionella sp.]
MSSRHSSLVSLLEAKARSQPDFPLYTFLSRNTDENRILTLETLAEQARKIAILLQKSTRPGERVIIIYPPGLELIAAFFGCLYAGVIAIPVYPPNTKALVTKLHHIIQNSGARVALTTDEILRKVKKLRVVKLLNKTPVLGKMVNHLAGPTFERNSQLLGWDFEKMHFLVTDYLSDYSDEGWNKPLITPDSLAFLQYTSGSTGKPKGVMVSHGNLLNNLAVMQLRNRSSEDDICVSWLPPYHDMGLIAGILQPLFTGYPVKLMAPMSFLQRPAAWLEAMSHFRGTITGAPNFAYDLCIDKITDDEKGHLDLSSWRIAATGSEPIRCSTIEKFTNFFEDCGFQADAFYPCYGLAESTLMVTAVDPNEGVQSQLVDNKALSLGQVRYCDASYPHARRLVNCGKPADDFYIMIVNPETLQVCTERKVGEIWVASKSVTQGYWQLPNESKYCFHAKIPGDERTFLRTGDLGYLAEGALYVTGRLKDMIIIRGCNYYPHDLEDIINGCHPLVRMNCGAIFSVEENEQEYLVVVQEIKQHIEAEVAREIIKIIRNRILKEHGITADIVVLAAHKAVPKTTSGKIQRLLCKKNYLEGSLEIFYIDSIHDSCSISKILQNVRFCVL